MKPSSLHTLRLGRALPLAAPLLLLLASCSKGEDGKAGTSCTIEESDGESTLVCSDGTRTVIEPGQPGEAGEAGEAGDSGGPGDPGDPGTDPDPCTVSDNGDGTFEITCAEGDPITVADSGRGVPLIETTFELPGGDCVYGGQSIRVGYDADGDGALSDDEVTDTELACELTGIVGDVTLSSQAEVDAFQDVGWVTGDLIIEGADIVDLSELQTLQSVGDYLQIQDNPELTSLDGLESLREIGGTLYISNNDKLLEIEALESLQTIGGEGWIQDNLVLESLAGLENVETMESWFYVANNEALMDLGDMPLLTENGGVQVENNPALADLAGLSSLQTTAFVYVANNSGLTSLVGFAALTEVIGNLLILNNDELLTLDGLSSLEAIGGVLEIQDHALLTDLRGLSSLATLEGNLVIEDNTALPTCEANWLEGNIATYGGTTTISGNDDGGVCP